MKTQNTVRKLIFALVFLPIFMLSSCMENDQEDFNNSKKDQLIEKSQFEKDEFQNKLINVSTILGVALQD